MNAETHVLHWALILVARGVATLAGFLIFSISRPRVAPVSTSHEIREIARKARRELEEGMELREVVIRCWARMVELLSPRRGNRGEAPSVTARKLETVLNPI